MEQEIDLEADLRVSINTIIKQINYIEKKRLNWSKESHRAIDTYLKEVQDNFTLWS